ncbi:MAG: HAD-IA family hydrolase [Rubrivivax sp.]|nr:HAD-IA family hydrolase [Rubrivivax sp.]
MSIHTIAPQALLLDFGSVISVSMFERHRQTEADLGLPAGSLTWLGPIDPETDPLWRSMQRDEITERDYWAQRAREIGEASGNPGWDMLGMLTRLRHTDPNAVVRPEMRSLILRARAKGLRVGILSNELELFNGRDFISRMDVLREMHAIVDATHTHILKPDPRAYALGVQGLGVTAERTLFVDDQFRNIAGAQRAGLQTQFFDLRDVDGTLSAIAARLRIPMEDTP